MTAHQAYTQTQDEPQLQPPGAGLPLMQRLLVRLILGPVISKRKTPAQCRVEYERLVGKIIENISEVPQDKRKIRVLVRPLPGLEDSSRYWSLNGILEHLLIVSKSVEQVILSLSSGHVPPGKADAATVKPSHMEADYLSEFKSYATGLMGSLDVALSKPGMDLNSHLRFRHPWFGPITARQWYWLLGTHVGIHYRQAKEIIKAL